MVFEGVTNLRDLGGYPTSDGRRVRRGRVYRSDHLGYLSDRDYESLASLSIATVCDFRRDDERERAPTRWRGSRRPEFLEAEPAAGQSRPADPVRVASSGGSADAVAEAMRVTYAFIPMALGPTYRHVFGRLVTVPGPLLVHCTAGKDRTGVFSALLLRLLGVAPETVMADYLLSNVFYATADRVDAMARTLRASVEATRQLLMVDAEWLDAAFRSIDVRYGSLEAYRQSVLALTDESLAELKTRLLEP